MDWITFISHIVRNEMRVKEPATATPQSLTEPHNKDSDILRMVLSDDGTWESDNSVSRHSCAGNSGAIWLAARGTRLDRA